MVDEIRHELDFQKLRDSWNALASGRPHSVFLRHEWFTAAWQWRRADASLCVLCVHHGNTIVGILPMIEPGGHGHAERVREFLTVPDTQYCDVLAAPEHEQGVCEALVKHLIRRASEWDKLQLHHVPPQSVVARCFTALIAVHGTHARLVGSDRNLFIALDGTWDEYYRSCSRSVRKAFKLAANRIERNGRFRVERIGSDDVDLQSARDVLDEIITVSANSWKGGSGYSLDAPGPHAFIRNLTDAAHATGWLSLWLLRIDGEPAAMEYQLVDDGRVYALRADFDERYRTVSPGANLSRHLLEAMFEQRLSRYYLGPGANAYKTRWSNIGEPLYTLRAYSPTLRGHALALWPQEVKPRLRSLKGQLDDALARHIKY